MPDVLTEKIKFEGAKLKLDGHLLTWVSHVKHLGHTLQENNSMSLDMNQKRGVFIGKVNSLMQEFRFASPQVLLNLVHTYACNIYGSNTWDLFSQDCERLSKSYNVTVRNILNLPRTTHRYLIEPLIDRPHLHVQMLARYATFGKALLANDSFPVRFLASLSSTDMRTILGRTLAKLSNSCGLYGDISNLNAKMVKVQAGAELGEAQLS